MSVINTNIAALSAQKNLSNIGMDLSKSIEKLSSGLRINRAEDDAAGLAIVERFNAQVRGVNQGIRNANDGISLVQLAEAALGEVSNILQRTRELAVQSANGTLDDSERASLQEEVDLLVEEIDNITQNVAFGNLKLLDGSISELTFQTGANVGNRTTINVSSVTVDSLGSSDTAGVTSLVSGTPIGSNDTGTALAAGDLVINGFAIGATSDEQDLLSEDFASSSAIAKAAAINEVDAGVRAIVGETRVEGVFVDLTTPGAVASANYAINGVTIAASFGGSDMTADLEGVAESINNESGQTGVRAEVVISGTQGRIDLVADNGANISVTNAAGAAISALGVGDGGVGNGNTATFTGSLTLISETASPITISTDGTIANSGFAIGEFSGSNASVVSFANFLTVGDTDAKVAGDVVINGIAVDGTRNELDNASFALKSSSAIAKVAAINEVSDITGVTATANANVLRGTAGTVGTAATVSFTLNNRVVSFATVANDTGTTLDNMKEAVNGLTALTGFSMEVDGNDFTLTGEDGRNATLDALTGVSRLSATLQDGQGGTVTFRGNAGGGITGQRTMISTFSLTSGGPIEIGTNTATGIDEMLKVGTYGSAEDGQLISQIDISTVKGAEDAITAIDNALDRISSTRGSFGAASSRLTSVVSNLQVTNQSMQAARSVIQDLDFAQATTDLSSTQIKQQAATAMLAQANTVNQGVLQLLG